MIRKVLIIGFGSDGFRFDDFGNLQKYTKDGRRRKNWKNDVHKVSKKFFKDKCEECGTTENLTIHFLVPLNIAVIILEENCQTLCRKCHTDAERSQLFNRNRTMVS